MKKWIKYSAVILGGMVINSSVFAQDQNGKGSKSEDKSQEIIIRKKGNKPEKMTIVVDGDNITINGKPADDFKNENVTIFKRDRDVVINAPRIRRLTAPRAPLAPESFDRFMPVNANKAILGVITEKAEDGVKVVEVTKEGGADKAGLKQDDVITKVGDTKIEESQDLVKAISNYKPKDKVDITYKRNGKESKTTAVLQENKMKDYSFNFNNRDFNFAIPEGSIAPPMQNFNFNFNRRPKIGLQIQDVEEGKGVKVKEVDEDSPASKAGLKEGDVVTAVNGKDIEGVDELQNEIKDVKEGDSVKLSYKRNGKTQTTEVKVPKRLKSADL